MDNAEILQRLEFAERTARQAGKVLLDSSDLHVNRKHGNDIVTAADYAAEELIVAAIRDEFPNDGILAEESGLTEMLTDVCWSVDPLDGTVNFANRIPCFGVVLSCRDAAGESLGIIFDPIHEQLYSGHRGGQSRCNGVDIGSQRAVSLGDAVLGLQLPPEMLGSQGAMQRWQAGCRGVRLGGSTAIDMAWTAAGLYDLFVYRRTPSRWDWAAGELIIERTPGCAVRTIGRFGGMDVVAAGSAPLVETLSPEFFLA